MKINNTLNKIQRRMKQKMILKKKNKLDNLIYLEKKFMHLLEIIIKISNIFIMINKQTIKIIFTRT